MEPRIRFEEVPQELYGLMRNIENYLKTSGLPHSLLELIKIRASQINGCGYCLDMHHKDAIVGGASLQRLYLLPAWKESPVFTDEEKSVLNLTETLTRIANVDVEDIGRAYDRVAQHYSKAEIAKVIMAINQINAWNRWAITLGTTPGSYKPDLSLKFQMEEVN